MIILSIYIVGSLLLSTLVCQEQYFWAGIDVIAGILLLWWLGAVAPLAWPAWIAANPQSILMIVGVYIACAVGWATFKWFLFVRSHAQKYMMLRKTFAEERNLSEQQVSLLHKEPQNFQDDSIQWKAMRIAKQARAWDARKPDEVTEDVNGKASIPVSKHSGKIVGWMFWWPASLVGWALGDLLVNFFEHVFDILKGYFQAIGDSQFK